MRFLLPILMALSCSPVARGNGKCEMDLKIGAKTAHTLKNCTLQGFLYPVGRALTGKFVFDLMALKSEDKEINLLVEEQFYRKNQYAAIDVYYFDLDTKIYEGWLQFNGVSKFIKGRGRVDLARKKLFFWYYLNFNEHRLSKKLPWSRFENTAHLKFEADIDAPTNGNPPLSKQPTG